jgi:hypothetical protein
MLRLRHSPSQGQRSRMFTQYYTLRLGRKEPVYCANSLRRRGLSTLFRRDLPKEESLWSQFSRRQIGSEGSQPENPRGSRFAQPPNAAEGESSIKL